MAAEPTSAEWEPSRRLPRARLGVAVVEEIVELIVTGKLKEGELLPPEGALCEHFGVSRTVLRESVKRLEEKGLVHVGQGRGTQVARSGSWNVLDHVVLSAMIDSDDSLAVLDELTVVRSALEAKMAGAVAGRRTSAELGRINRALSVMREAKTDSDAFRQEDVVFHFTIMEISRNRLAENIAKNLYRRALESAQYQGVDFHGAYEFTLRGHTEIYEVIAGKEVAGAEEAMRLHIEQGWERRRPRV